MHVKISKFRNYDKLFLIDIFQNNSLKIFLVLTASLYEYDATKSCMPHCRSNMIILVALFLLAWQSSFVILLRCMTTRIPSQNSFQRPFLSITNNLLEFDFTKQNTYVLCGVNNPFLVTCDLKCIISK